MFKKQVSIVICLIICFQAVSIPSARAASVNGAYISSGGACVMDFDTGEILYQHNGDTPRVPASMTKLMTVYCVYDAIRSGKISMDTVVPISAKAYSVSRNPAYQTVPLYYNTTYTVDEMIGIVVTYSACAPALALAELVSGSEAEFVKLMNDTAQRMKINAKYYDCFGVMNNQVSPVAMVTLSRNLIKEFPDIITRTSKRSISFHGGTYYSTNKLFSSYYYPGADGLKTGTTTASGYCFCGTAVRNGRRVIAVTMASSSSNQRFADVVTLLNYGFSVPVEIKPVLDFTDKRTFVNGYEVPTLFYFGKDGSRSVVIAEALMYAGFDTHYDEASKTLTLQYNPAKEASQQPMDYYRYKAGQKAYDVAAYSENKVVINDGYSHRAINSAYSINGYMAIAVDELNEIYDVTWGEDANAFYINTGIVKRYGNIDKNKSILFTDMSTYINGSQVPTFAFDGDGNGGAMIVAEDLQNYGFDIDYSPESRTLSLTYTPGKIIKPIPLDYYKNKNGQKAFSITDSDITVEITVNGKTHTIQNTHSTNGYMCISADELGTLGTSEWNDTQKAVIIKF